MSRDNVFKHLCVHVSIERELVPLGNPPVCCQVPFVMSVAAEVSDPPLTPANTAR